MRVIYSILSHITYAHIWVAQYFSKKLHQFVDGRKHSFNILSNAIHKQDKTIWMHCASLGEFEQGVPILESVIKHYPNFKIVVTFFSPSGYQIKKNTPLADAVCYLPFDTPANARRFITTVNPILALFIKYEVWPNYLFELNQAKVPTFLISGTFRKNQIYFKSYGSFMRKALQKFDHFFVQDTASKALLETIGFQNITISGDTRFDRVCHQIAQDNSLPFMEVFKGDAICIVCGSTWPEDETVLLPYINASSSNVKFVIAPHKIETSKIDSFSEKIKNRIVRYSELSTLNNNREDNQDITLTDAKVLIIDTIGLLTKIYSYADMAYVGGAMGKTGLHNILEAATFGIPIVIGKHFDNFPEAIRLQQLAGLFSISNAEEASSILNKLVEDKSFRHQTGMVAGHFINSNTGATQLIMQTLQQILRP